MFAPPPLNSEISVLEGCPGLRSKQHKGGRHRVDLWACGSQDLSIGPDWQTGLKYHIIYIMNRGTLAKQECVHRDWRDGK